MKNGWLHYIFTKIRIVICAINNGCQYVKMMIRYIILAIFCLVCSAALCTEKDSILDYYLRMHRKYQYKDPDLAIYYLDEVENYARNNPNQLLSVYTTKGWYFINRFVQIDTAICALDRAIALIPKCTDSINIGKTYTRRGVAASKNHEISEALLWYQDALTVYNKIHNYKGVMYVYNQIGNAYLKLAIYNKAFANYYKALETARLHPDANPGIALKNLGKAYKNSGDYTKAETYLLEALAENTKRNKSTMIMLCKTQLAELYYYLKDYDKAIQFARENEMYRFKREQKKDLAKIHLLLSKIYFDLQNDSLALHYAKRAYRKGVKINRLVPQRDAAEHLALIYERLQKPEKAFKYNKIYHKLKDSLLISEIRNKIEKQHLLKAITEKENTIVVLHQDSKEKRIQLFFSSSAGVLAVLIGFLIYRRKKSSLLQKLSKEEKEKIRIAEKLNEQKAKTSKLQNELEAYIRTLSKNRKENTSVLEMDSIKDAIEQLHNFRILTEDDWTVFKLLFHKVHPDFFENFKHNVPQHSPGDIKLASFIRLHLNNNEIARILGISTESVRKGKYRLRKKLALVSEKKLQSFIYTL